MQLIPSKREKKSIRIILFPNILVELKLFFFFVDLNEFRQGKNQNYVFFNDELELAWGLFWLFLRIIFDTQQQTELDGFWVNLTHYLMVKLQNRLFTWKFHKNIFQQHSNHVDFDGYVCFLLVHQLPVH